MSKTRYTPDTSSLGKKYYRVIAINTDGGNTSFNRSVVATIWVRDREWMTTTQVQDYLAQLRQPFVKLCRLRFLNPDGSTAFFVDNIGSNEYSNAFIADGSISVNLQNGQRRTATVTFDNTDDKFNYNVNNLWFGTEVALDEGLILPDGSPYYIQQGVFLLDTPTETLTPNTHTITYNLLDKWANLDGTLNGNLEGTYEIPVNTNIFEPIATLLSEDKGNGYPLDRVPPVFTSYYNNKTQSLPDGTNVSMAISPYTLTIDGDSGTKADIITGLSTMLNAWVGYDETGALRIDPSQDDISDATKPILWEFSTEEAELMGLTYTIRNTAVYNDYIVVGEQLNNYIPTGRAQNLDPSSDTNVNIIGRKTIRETKAGYGTDTMCQDYAEWMLKRSTVLQKAITISCSQMFHIYENALVTISRTDKEGMPTERHLIQGFTRPLAYNGEMQINCVSVQDFPNATKSSWG